VVSEFRMSLCPVAAKLDMPNLHPKAFLPPRVGWVRELCANGLELWVLNGKRVPLL